MKVKDAMHKGVRWMSPDTPVAELARIMRDQDIGAIPIGENDRLVGMVTDRDIVCKGLAKTGFDPKTATAGDVMSQGIHCCGEEHELAEAVRHMRELGIRRLTVIGEGERMTGMISLGDIGHAASSDLAHACLRGVAAHH
jgi:CBS domain-containing protein